MLNFLIQRVEDLLLILLVCRILLLFEKQVLKLRLREIDKIVGELTTEKAGEYLTSPPVLRVLRIWDIREGTPRLERYSSRLIVQKQINEIFTSL